MIPALLSHLLQSTLFAGAAWLLALALRKYRAQLRFWIFFAASAKFLIPFAVLVSLGALAPRQATAPRAAAWVDTIEQMGEPLIVPAVAAQTAVQAATAASPIPWEAIALAAWSCGFGTILVCWLVRWRRVRVLRVAASPLALEFPVPVMSAPGLLEPGVFGIFRPVLLLPEGIVERLHPAELDAILAHEACHVCRRDNLTAAIHMTVQAIFWFHPLVWWLGARLVEERERACDEQVLSLGMTPRTYAAGILNVCRHYVESPLACVSGVTGSNLKRRIEAIMSGQAALRLTMVKKAGVLAAGATAVVVPLVVGVVRPTAIQAQPAAVSAKFEVASIKACKSGYAEGAGGGKKGGGGGGGIKWDPERLHEECQSLYNLVRDAYLAYPEGKAWTTGTREESSADARGRTNGGCTGCGRGLPPVSWRLFQQVIQGSPAWVNSDRYTIDAKAEHPASPEMMRGPMMQALLEDRFKLKIHRESRDMPVYELTVADGGPKFQPSPEGSCLTFSEVLKLPPKAPARYHGPAMCGSVAPRDGKTLFPGTTMVGFCRNLSLMFDRDVIDKTGITGLYDLHVDADEVLLPTNDSQPHDDGMPPPPPQRDRAATGKAFQRALPKIGLKLEPSKGPGVFLVIDHLEKPSEN